MNRRSFISLVGTVLAGCLLPFRRRAPVIRDRIFHAGDENIIPAGATLSRCTFESYCQLRPQGTVTFHSCTWHPWVSIHIPDTLLDVDPLEWYHDTGRHRQITLDGGIRYITTQHSSI